MWITVAQSDEVLEGTNRGWDDVSDADKALHIKRSSNRLELVPFSFESSLQGDGVPAGRPHGRYVNGFATDATGTAVSSQPIPAVMKIACAELALWYSLNPRSELNEIDEGLADDQYTAFIADLPIAVRSALWEFLPEQVRGTSDTGAGSATVTVRAMARELVFT